MVHHAVKFAERAVCDARCRVMLAGGVIGWVVWELSQLAGNAGQNLTIALVVVVAGTAAIVLAALHAHTVRAGDDATALLRSKTRSYLSAAGCGIALAIHSLQALLG